MGAEAERDGSSGELALGVDFEAGAEPVVEGELMGNEFGEVVARCGEEHEAVAGGAVAVEGGERAGADLVADVSFVEAAGTFAEVGFGYAGVGGDGVAEDVVHLGEAEVVAGEPDGGAEELPAVDVAVGVFGADPAAAGVDGEQGAVEVEEGDGHGRECGGFAGGRANF